MHRSLILLLLAFSVVLPAGAQQMGEGAGTPAPMSKMMIETPLKRAINPAYGLRSRPAKPVAGARVLPEQSLGVDDKGVEKVRPGAVSWRADFDAACRNAQASGKPVLLFAMIGNLDDKFC